MGATKDVDAYPYVVSSTESYLLYVKLSVSLLKLPTSQPTTRQVYIRYLTICIRSRLTNSHLS